MSNAHSLMRTMHHYKKMVQQEKEAAMPAKQPAEAVAAAEAIHKALGLNSFMHGPDDKLKAGIAAIIAEHTLLLRKREVEAAFKEGHRRGVFSPDYIPKDYWKVDWLASKARAALAQADKATEPQEDREGLAIDALMVQAFAELETNPKLKALFIATCGPAAYAQLACRKAKAGKEGEEPEHISDAVANINVPDGDGMEAG